MANRSQAQAPREVRAPSFSLDDPAFVAIVEAAVKARLAASQPEPKAKVLDYDKLTVAAFRKAGFGEVKPRVDAKTYNLWLADGYRVKPGETAVRVKQLRLFARSQVEPMSKAEAKKAQAALAEKAAKRTADKLPAVSPVETAKPPVAAKPAKAPAKRKTVPITQATA
jgi:hypothetical protein